MDVDVRILFSMWVLSGALNLLRPCASKTKKWIQVRTNVQSCLALAAAFHLLIGFLRLVVFVSFGLVSRLLFSL